MPSIHFWYEHEEWRALSFDGRERSEVAIDRGVDAYGNERRLEAVRVRDHIRRRFSYAEAGIDPHNLVSTNGPKWRAFDWNLWKRRFTANSERAERNSLMDSGWSAGTADECMRTVAILWRELIVALAEAATTDLAAIQECARWALTNGGAA